MEKLDKNIPLRQTTINHMNNVKRYLLQTLSYQEVMKHNQFDNYDDVIKYMLGKQRTI